MSITATIHESVRLFPGKTSAEYADLLASDGFTKLQVQEVISRANKKGIMHIVGGRRGNKHNPSRYSMVGAPRALPMSTKPPSVATTTGLLPARNSVTAEVLAAIVREPYHTSRYYTERLGFSNTGKVTSPIARMLTRGLLMAHPSDVNKTRFRRVRLTDAALLKWEAAQRDLVKHKKRQIPDIAIDQANQEPVRDFDLRKTDNEPPPEAVEADSTFAQAVAKLREKRDHHLAQAKKIEEAIALLDALDVSP